jgi:hypothetical protein
MDEVEELEINPEYQLAYFDAKQTQDQEALGAMVSRVREYFDMVLPNCRAKSLAITALDETFLWAGYAISHGELTNPKR